MKMLRRGCTAAEDLSRQGVGNYGFLSRFCPNCRRFPGFSWFSFLGSVLCFQLLTWFERANSDFSPTSKANRGVSRGIPSSTTSYRPVTAGLVQGGDKWFIFSGGLHWLGSEWKGRPLR